MIVAHVFLAPYTLPVPFWLYLYGCAAALVLSFALLAYLAASMPAATDERHEVLRTPWACSLWMWSVRLLRAGAVLALAITIASGFWGPLDPGLNVAMTIFWVWFLLAFAYLTIVVGDVYAWTNPWKTIAVLLERAGLDMTRARVPYPAWLAYWPAFGFYVALIWIELFALPRPATLASALAIYTVIMLAGIFITGRASWLRYADVFGVFFRVIGSLAPVEYVDDGQETPRVALRRPLSGALRSRAEHPSLVVFILFMLSSTTYDTIHQTYMWISLYWRTLVPMFQPLWGTDVIAAQGMLTDAYEWYQRLGLAASPLPYLVVYLAVLCVASIATRTQARLSDLSAAFAFSLVPIAVAYHATHYFPSMLLELFGLVTPLPMAVVWHAQVAVLLAGHVAAVYLAHVTALRVFSTRAQGVVSQLPMLALMVAYTCLGLWALSMPLGVPQVVPD